MRLLFDTNKDNNAALYGSLHFLNSFPSHNKHLCMNVPVYVSRQSVLPCALDSSNQRMALQKKMKSYFLLHAFSEIAIHLNEQELIYSR